MLNGKFDYYVYCILREVWVSRLTLAEKLVWRQLLSWEYYVLSPLTILYK